MAEKIELRAFEATPIEAIPTVCNKVRETFATNKTKDVEWRKVQLRKLYWAIEDFRPRLLESLKRDLNKGTYEATLTELDWVQGDCLFMLKHLDSLTADEYLGSPEVPLAMKLMGLRIHKEPRGAALIIGAYNYPLTLLLCPMVGAIAAGCTVVAKPPEAAGLTAMVVEELIAARLDPDAFRVVNGAVPETTALLDQPWDHIFYTGGASVARIVSRRAAENLTPVTLELGGRNPAFITPAADLRLAARRTLWSKTLNAGQVCTSLNYVLIDRTLVEPFAQELKKAWNDFFPDGARDSELAHIINERQFLRIKKMIDDTKGRILVGGGSDQSNLFIEPTAVLVDSVEDSVIVDESFGPLFGVLPVDDLAEAIEIANRVHRTPLGVYAFGSKDENNKILNGITSGGATFNDCFSHATLPTVPFGGVGDSGSGAYRGRASFECFTHRRTVADVPRFIEPFLRVRYMPYLLPELKRFRRMAGLTAHPGFDRDGKIIKGPSYWAKKAVVGSPIGGGAVTGVFVRFILGIVAAWVWRNGWTVPEWAARAAARAWGGRA